MSIFKRIHKGISMLLVMALIIGGVSQNVVAIENESDVQETSKDSTNENVEVDASSKDIEQGTQEKEKQQKKEEEKIESNKEENKPIEDKASKEVNSKKEEKNKEDVDKESKEAEEEKQQEKEKIESNKEENKPIEDKASKEVNSKKEEKNKEDEDKESKEAEEEKQQEKEKIESNKEENKPIEDKASKEVISNKEEKNKADVDKESRGIEEEKVSQEEKQQKTEIEKIESNKEENKTIEDQTNDEEKSKADIVKEEREASIKKLQNTTKTDIGLKENYTQKSLNAYENALKQAKNIDLKKAKLEEINNSITQLEEAIKNLEEKKVETIQDGLYEVEKEATDEEGNPSPFARMHIGEKLKYEVKNGKHYVELRLRKSEWSKIDEIKVDEKVVEYKSKEEKNCKDPYGQSETVTDQLIKFEVPNQKSEIILQGSILPDGDEEFAVPCTVYLRIKEDTLKKVEEEKPNTDFDKDGLYQINLKRLHGEKDEASMAADYIEEIGNIEVKNGKKTCIVTLKRSDWMYYIKIEVNGEKVPHQLKVMKTYDQLNEKGKNQTDSIMSFEIPEADVQIRMHLKAIPMGDIEQVFRIVPQKDTAKYLGDKTDGEREIAIRRLQNAIEAKIDPEENYTKESYKVYKEVLNQAKNIDVEKKGTEEISRIAEDLEKAIATLKIREDIIKYEGKVTNSNEDLNWIMKDEGTIQIIDEKKYVEIALKDIPGLRIDKISIDGKIMKHSEKKEGEYLFVKYEVKSIESEMILTIPVMYEPWYAEGKIVFDDETIKKVKEYEEKVELNKNGEYTILALALKEDSEDPSMTNQFIKEPVTLKVKDGKVIAKMVWNGTEFITMDMIEELKYENSNGAFVDVKRKLDSKNNAVTIEFEVEDINKATIMQVYVPRGMGEGRPKFRLVFDLDSLKIIKEYNKDENQEKSIEISVTAPTEVKISDNEKNIVISKITEEIIKNGELKIHVGDTKNATVKIPVKVEKESQIKQAKLPKISMESNIANVEIPTGVDVKSQNEKWDGTIKLPTLIENESVKITNIKPEKVVEVGFEGGTLEFNQAVRIVLKGQTGKKAGYIKDDKIIEIEHTLSENTQKVANEMKWQETKIDDGKDLIIWTKHFTKFVAYIDDTTGGNTGGNTGGSNGNKESKFYKIDVELLKGDTNQESTGERFLGKKAIYEEKDGKKYIKLVVKRTDKMKDVKVMVDGSVKKFDVQNVKNEGGKTVSTIKFEIPNLSSEIEVNLRSEFMGNVLTKFKIKFNESSMKETTNPDDLDYSLDGLKDDPTIGEDMNLDGVEIEVLKEDSNEQSMAHAYIGKKAGFEVRDGKQYLTVYIKRSEWMKNIDITVDGKSVKYDRKVVKTSSKEGENITVEFEIPNLDAKIKFHMNVLPMGEARVAFRIVPKKDTMSEKAKSSMSNSSTVKVSNIDKNKDDLYQATIKVLKENQDEPSIAKDYIDEKVDIKVKDKKIYMIMYFKHSKDIKDLEIKVEGKTVKHEMKTIKEHEEGKADSFVQFEIPEFESKIIAEMNIQADKNKKVTFRIVPQKDTLVKKVNTSVTKDGLYEMGMEVVDKYDTVLSLAKKHLSDQVDFEVKNDKKYVQVLLKEKDAIKDLEVIVDDKKVEYENVNEKIKVNEEKFAAIRFEIPSLDSKIKFNILTNENDLVEENKDIKEDKKVNKNEEKKYVTINVVLKKNTMKQIESKVYLYIDSKNIYRVNSEGTEKITLDVAPVIETNRTLVPLKGVCEALGINVLWQEETRGVLLSKDDVKIQLHIDSMDAEIGEESIKLEVAPKIINDRTFVPLRFMSENLEYRVDWMKEENKMVITKKANVDKKKI
ncbi:NEAT domain-containing protein [Inediibacterium massiliense]|uniref:NEAT domain-containing protein n=1 Tax=Inediibacterium massiliense TaxID=1658111 RepID=UPI0006B3FA74|nr:NEAT domain-containing protein [Inediibacterium massiliense]